MPAVRTSTISAKMPRPHLPSLSNVQLPQAPNIATILKTHCIGHSLAKQLTRTYERHISDLRKCTEAQVQGLLQHYQENMISSDIHERQLARYISLYESRVEHWYTLLSNEIKPKKSEFNTDRVPLLITYFKHNAYPSTNDRIWLARETGNTTQQIGIWFQNRRRRSRKAGVELKRASPDELPHNLFAEVPEACLSHSLATHLDKRPRLSSSAVTAVEEASVVYSSLSGTSTTRPHKHLRTRHDFADFETPPYTDKHHTSSPSCWSRPTKLQFPEPNWDRKPVLCRDARPARSSAVSLDDLVSMMSLKLRLFCRHPSPSPVTGTPWYAALYTYPSPSPLPALIRSRPSLKRKRSEIDEGQPSPRSKRFRSLSASSDSSFIGGDSRSSDNSSSDSSSPGPQTPPSALFSLPLSPRFVDWSKYSIPTVPRAYGLP